MNGRLSRVSLSVCEQENKDRPCAEISSALLSHLRGITRNERASLRAFLSLGRCCSVITSFLLIFPPFVNIKTRTHCSSSHRESIFFIGAHENRFGRANMRTQRRRTGTSSAFHVLLIIVEKLAAGCFNNCARFCRGHYGRSLWHSSKTSREGFPIFRVSFFAATSFNAWGPLSSYDHNVWPVHS